MAPEERLDRFDPHGGQGQPPPLPASEAVASAAGSLAVRVIRGYRRDDGAAMASMIAFNLIVSLFPLVLAVASVAGLVVHSGGARAVTEVFLHALVPGGAGRQQVEAMLADFHQRAGLLGAFGLAGLLWAGSRLFGALEDAFSRIFHTPHRAFLAQKAMAAAMTAALAAALVLAVLSSSLPLAHGAGLGHLRQPPGGAAAWAVAEATGLVGAFLLFALIFSVVPVRRMPWHAVWPGAALAAAGFQALSLLFPTYSRLIHASTTFGATFGLMFLLLLWMYLVAELLVVGAELIAALEAGAGRGPRPGPGPSAP